MISLKRKPKEEQSKVQGCEYSLVISCNSEFFSHYNTRPLANELVRRGVNILLSRDSWPRDELFFYPDGRVEYVPLDYKEYKDFKLPLHEAYAGGKFLKGNGFIIASDTMNLEKKANTLSALGVEKAFYLDLTKAFEYFLDYHERYCYRKNFFNDEQRHIDRMVNIGNTKRMLFTYDAPVLQDILKDVASEIGYSLVCLPREESGFGAINFVELGNHMVVDKSAKRTIKVLEELGYKIIRTPTTMSFCNIKGGGVRCSCTEIPNSVYERIDFAPKKKWWQGEPAFKDLEGRAARIYTDRDSEIEKNYIVPIAQSPACFKY